MAMCRMYSLACSGRCEPRQHALRIQRLDPGLSLIVLFTLLLKTFLYGNIFNALFFFCLADALLSYFFFEN
jgi:hypothetical protein